MTYLSPGVYIEEVPSGPQPIAAASTSVVAVLGTTRKGPYATPTRVTGWTDFVRAFGEPTPRGFAGESVFGFFENGGPAAYIVRVDPSTPGTWTAFDSGGNASFVISASSPGAWASAMTIGLRPEEAEIGGSLFRTATTANANAAAGGTTIPVASTTGLRPGDPIVLSAPPTNQNIPAVVVAAVAGVPDATTISVAGNQPLPAGSVIAGAAAAGATELFLPSGKGLKIGDVLLAIAPDGSRTSALVTALTPSGGGVTVALAASLGAVPGAAFAARRTALAATAVAGTAPAGGPPVSSLSLAQLTFGSPTATVTTDELDAFGARIVVADGRAGEWDTANDVFDVIGSAAIPPGPATVTAPLIALPLAETGLSLTDFTGDDVASAFGFVPEDAQVRLTGPGVTAAEQVVATRSGPTFTLAPAAPAAGKTYTTATFEFQANADAGIVVRASAPLRTDDFLRLGSGNATRYLRITGTTTVGGGIQVLSFAAGTAVPNNPGARFPVFAFEEARIVAARFGLDVHDGANLVESFGGLSLSEAHPAYYAADDVVNGASAFVTVAPRAAGAPGVALSANPVYAEATQLGADRPPTNADYAKALRELEAESEPALIIAPDTVTIPDPLLQIDVIGKVVAHAEKFRLFAIVDGPDEDDDQALVAWRNNAVASTYAAVYAPHVSIVTINGSSDRFTTVPPSGFIAGVFARTDRERGVHKAPANERVTGIVGLAQAYTQRRQDLLNPNAVNLLRAFPGRGSRIWGARNATDDTTWRYVNVRRLFNMIETSVERSTQWVVFEPNTASTWIRVKASVENFLEQLWRAGALAGASTKEAYRVRVGLGETMTETDIDLGLVIIEVAIAPAKPAEFVVFRFSHKRLSE